MRCNNQEAVSNQITKDKMFEYLFFVHWILFGYCFMCLGYFAEYFFKYFFRRPVSVNPFQIPFGKDFFKKVALGPEIFNALVRNPFSLHNKRRFGFQIDRLVGPGDEFFREKVCVVFRQISDVYGAVEKITVGKNEIIVLRKISLNHFSKTQNINQEENFSKLNLKPIGLDHAFFFERSLLAFFREFANQAIFILKFLQFLCKGKRNGMKIQNPLALRFKVFFEQFHLGGFSAAVETRNGYNLHMRIDQEIVIVYVISCKPER